METESTPKKDFQMKITEQIFEYIQNEFEKNQERILHHFFDPLIHHFFTQMNYEFKSYLTIAAVALLLIIILFISNIICIIILLKNRS